MKARVILIVATLLAVGFPRFEEQGRSYQKHLWTSEGMKREYPSSGFLFKIGSIEGERIWNRVRLGFPFGATTIDSRLSDGVVQGRVELIPLATNLLQLGIPGLGLSVFARIVRAISRAEPDDPDGAGPAPRTRWSAGSEEPPAGPR